MRASTFLAGAAMLGRALAEDLLFVDTLQYTEYTEATAMYSAKVVTQAQFKSMTTAQFAAYKAIIIPSDPSSADMSMIQFLDDSKAAWSPAVTGNMVIIGTDPNNHLFGTGARTLIQNSIKFAASGATTGLYFSLGHYYQTSTDTDHIASLSLFGSFGIRADFSASANGCYDNAAIVATSPAITTLADSDLSNWSCSVHEAFWEFPTSGPGGFQALAIAKDVIGKGSQTFANGTVGLPYIISRGATPLNCGNGVFEPSLLEECDLGSGVNGAAGSVCDVSCKCLYGVANAAAGTCKPKPGTGTGSPSGTVAPPMYTNVTVSVPYPVTVTNQATVTPAPVVINNYYNIIIGVEIVVIVDITLVCPPGSSVTTTVTKVLSTMQRPIYATSTLGYPCYVCAVGTPKRNDFVTVINTICPASHIPATPTYQPCGSCAATAVTARVPGLATTTCGGCVTIATGTGKMEMNPGSPAPSTPAYTAVRPTTASSGVVASGTPKVVYAGAPRNAAAAGAVVGLVGVVAALL